MPNTLRIKRRATGAAGAPSSLANAELAFNEVDNTLYYGKGTGGAGGTATTVDAIGGSGAFATLTSAQTISGIKTFSALPAVSATLSTSDNSTNVATTAFVKSQGYLTGNQSVTLSGDVSGSGSTSISVSLAAVGTAGTYTKVTTDSKGRVTSGTTLSASDIPTLTASKISDFDTQVRTSRLDQMAVPTSTLNLNGQKISLLADPTLSGDAATKGYVDSVAQGLDAKASVIAATTANITLSGTQTIDGIALSSGDRVLVKNQTTSAQNGIYVVDVGSWTRASDADTWNELRSAFVFVEQGTTQSDTGWVCNVDAGGTIGSTAVSWVQFSGAGTYLAGTNLTLSGNTFSVSSSPSFSGRVSMPAASSSTGLKIASGFIATPAVGDSGVVEYDGSVINIIDQTGTRRRLFSDGQSIDNAPIGSTTPASGTFTTFTTMSGYNNVFNGNVLLKAVVNMNAGTGTVLTLPAGSASKVPIFLVSGTLATTAVAHGVEWDGTSLYLTNSSAVRKTVAYTDSNITGNAATVTNGVYTTGSYADPSWITSLAKSKVGLGSVENTALSTWAGSGNITTVGTLSSGTVPTSLLSGDLDGGTF